MGDSYFHSFQKLKVLLRSSTFDLWYTPPSYFQPNTMMTKTIQGDAVVASPVMATKPMPDFERKLGHRCCGW